MRWTKITAILTFIITSCYAFSVSDIPQCPLSCVVEALPKSKCAPTDQKCICTDPQLSDYTQHCVLEKCLSRDSLLALKIAKELCGTPVHDQRKLPTIVIPTLGSVAVIFVVIRIITRISCSWESFGWDDALIVLSMAATAPFIVITPFTARIGIGLDIWQVTPDNIQTILRYLYIGELEYVLTNGLTKMSILCFYLRVFPHERFRKLCYVVLAMTAAFTISFLLGLTFQCRPISYAWTRWDNTVKGTCVNIHAGSWAHAGLNISLDLIVLILPIPILLKLNMSTIKRVQVLSMFSVGTFVTIISLIRLRSLVSFAKTKNPTADIVQSVTWSAIEMYIGIACACMPTAKLFFQRVLPRWLGIKSDDTLVNSSAPPSKKNATPIANSDDSHSSHVRRRPMSICMMEHLTSDSGFHENIDLESLKHARTTSVEDIGIAR